MAWRFDAATDKILVASGWTGSAATVLMWIKRVVDRGAGSNPWRAWSSNAGAGSTVAGVGTDGGGDTIVSFDSAFSNLTGISITDNAWHCVALVMNGTAWALFGGTDPSSLGKVTGTKANATTPGSFTLSDSPDFFSGDIAAVKLFGRALSDAEVAAELATYAQVSATNLLFRATLSTTSNTPETGTTMTAGGTGITLVAGPPALDTITGVLAPTLQKPTSAIAGTVTDQGALAVTLQKPVGGLVGTVPDRGQLGATLQLPTAALTGNVIDAGQLAITLPVPVGHLAGTFPAVGLLAVTLQKPRSAIHDALPVLILPVRAGEPVLAPYLRAGQPVPA